MSPIDPANTSPPPEAASALARHARGSAQYGRRLHSALALLREAAQQHAGCVVQASSLGVEDMVLTDLIRRHALPIPVAMLDTGLLHSQTLDLLRRLQSHYGIELEVWKAPEPAVQAFVAGNGSDAMYRSVALRQACCALRKLEPLQRMLAARSAWITGLRREQSAQRGDLQARQTEADARLKFSPLFDWSLGDVWQYVADFGVPYNTLHDRFFPSIGCAPCTRAVSPGEDLRAGRWWWERGAAKECGLHQVRGSQAAPGARSAA